MAARTGADLQDFLAVQLGERHLHHRHVLAETEHVLELGESAEQSVPGQLLIDAVVERVIERLPEGLNILFGRVMTHGNIGVPHPAGPYLYPMTRPGASGDA